MNKLNFTYMLILAMFLWGAGWTALKIITPNIPMDVIIFWRFLIMSISFIPILIFLKKPLKIDRNSLIFISSSSVLNILFMVFSFYGVKSAMASSGGVIITTLTPVMTFLLVAIIFRKKLLNIQYFGLLIGTIGGVILLQLNDLTLFFNSSNIYFLLCAISWAGVTMLSQHSQKHINPIHYSFYISVIATIATFIYSYNSNILLVFNEGIKFWSALLYLAIFGQTVATTIFFVASGKLGSEKSSSFMFLVPLFSILVAWIVLDEKVETHILFGGIISIIAVYFINKSK